MTARHWRGTGTAAVLGCSTGNVKSQAARGLAHLRAALSAAVAAEGGQR